MGDITRERQQLEDRVLLLVPGGREAELSRRLLGEAGIASAFCADLAQLCRELEGGAGAVLLTDALLSAGTLQPFLTCLANQPVWSDLPVVLSLESASSSLEAARAMSLLDNVTLLERPVRLATLVSVLRAALRARARQYQIRDHLSGERQRAAAAIAASEERLRLVIDAAQDGIWDWDLTQDRAFWSDLTFRLLGYEPGELTPSYQMLQAIVHPEDAAREAAVLRRHLEDGQPYSVELRMRRKDGSYGWFQAQGQVQRNRAGQPVRMVGSLHDISDRKQAELALLEADRCKDEFLAMLAHELRNPLAPIRYAVQMLGLVEPASALLRKQREVIDRQVTHMGRLLDDLLDVSRITQGKIQLKRERLDLRDVVEQALDSMRPFIEGRGQHLGYQEPGSPLPVDGDPTRLEQIVRNLLHNAHKFTEAGGCIGISLERETDHEHQGQVVIRVRDSGVGLTPEIQPHVFEAFVQAEQTLARTQGGLGIGLAMVKRLVQLHGGEVEVYSAGAGRGSEFIVRLPLAQPRVDEPPGPQIQGALALGEHDSPRCRVLVVDDNVDAASSLSELLDLWGHEVHTAHDGQHALADAHQWRPEVILLDIGLPGMNGYEIAEHLRQDPATTGAFIVALTGYGSEEDRRRALEAGFNQHMTKPVELERLQTILIGCHAA